MNRGLLARKPVAKLRYDMTNPITTSAWTQILAAMTEPASAMEIFNGSDSILMLAFAAAAAEDANVFPYYVLPGGSGILLPVELSKGKRIAAKALNHNTSSGDLILNFFG